MNYLRYGNNWVTISQGNRRLGKLMKKKYSQLRIIDNHGIFIPLCPIHRNIAKKILIINYEIY